MIQYIEIVNRGTSIKIVTKDSNSDGFNEPIEIDVNTEVNTLEEIVTTIKNYIDNGNIHRDTIRG